MIGSASKVATLVAIMTVIGTGVALSQSPPQDDLVSAAAELYGIGDYQTAAKAYEQAVELGARDAVVYHNLGLALLAAGRPESAVLAFRRSLALDPSNSSARSGLSAARAEIDGSFPPPEPITETVAGWVTSYVPPAVLMYTAIAAALLISMVWLGLRLFSYGMARPASVGAVVVLAIFAAAAATAAAIDNGRDGNDAVATTDLALYSGPAADYVVLDTAPAGTEMEVVDMRGEWVRLNLTSSREGVQRQGWAKAESIAWVLP